MGRDVDWVDVGEERSSGDSVLRRFWRGAAGCGAWLPIAICRPCGD